MCHRVNAVSFVQVGSTHEEKDFLLSPTNTANKATVTGHRRRGKERQCRCIGFPRCFANLIAGSGPARTEYESDVMAGDPGLFG
jgi:hypothetical protein